MEMTMSIEVLFLDGLRCPLHGEALTSLDGLYDAPCGQCEVEMDADYESREYVELAGTSYGFGLVREEDFAWLRGRSLHPLLTLTEVEADLARDREISF